jgi:hypothetical protein
LQAVGLGHLHPAFAELAALGDEHFFVSWDGASDGRLHAGRARTGDGQHVVGGEQKFLESLVDGGEGFLETGGPMVIDRLGHFIEHFGRNVSGTGGEQSLLDHGETPNCKKC